MALTVQRVIDNTLLFLRDRKTAYQLTFNKTSGASRIVWADLLKFSKWGEGAFHENQRITDRILGRQEVVRRILQHANLTERQLMILYNGGPIPDLIEDKETDL